MKIASWIFTGIAYALLITVIVLSVVLGAADEIGFAIVVSLLAYCLPGFVGHMLISKHRRKTGSFDKSGLAVYILSFPPFIIPFLLLALLALIVWALDAIIYLFTNEHYMFQFVAWVWSQLTVSNFSFRKSSKDSQDEQEVFQVIENGLTRTLTFWGYANTIQSQNLQLTGPTPAYRDDVGNFWITTDGGQHFTAVNRGFDDDCSISKAD